jgi:hypothetical protein
VVQAVAVQVMVVVLVQTAQPILAVVVVAVDLPFQVETVVQV